MARFSKMGGILVGTYTLYAVILLHEANLGNAFSGLFVLIYMVPASVLLVLIPAPTYELPGMMFAVLGLVWSLNSALIYGVGCGIEWVWKNATARSP